MEILKLLPFDGFRAVEARLRGMPKIYLNDFTDAITDACRLHGVDSETLTRRGIQGIFHHVDFYDRGFVSWDQITTHIIEDSFRVMAASKDSDPGGLGRSGSGSGGSAELTKGQELSSLDYVGATRQLPTARVRMLKYIDQWDRMLRVLHVNNNQETVLEMTSVGSADHVSKVSRSVFSPTLCVEAVPEHSLVVASHHDMSCSFHGAQVLREGPTATSMLLHRIVPRRETEESTTALLWHPANQRLYSGFRSGRIAEWNLKMERSLVTERYQLPPLADRMTVYDQPLSCMIPFEDKVICGSVASLHNIALVDTEHHATVERLKGHQLGVQCIARCDTTDMIVSGGFEQTPYLWILKIKDFPPWKLVDKAEPHKSCITYVSVPPLSYKVISADDKGMIKLWDIRTSKCVQTMYGDQPPAPKANGSGGGGAAGSAVSMAIQNHFHGVAFHSTRQCIVSCGPQNLHVYRGNIPTSMDATDDTPVQAMLHHATNCHIYTAHINTVKVWCQKSGAVVTQYNNVCNGTITAMCFDNRGRKIFIGTSHGDVLGFCVTTGSRFRTFRSVDGEVRALAYGCLRNGARCLLGVTATEMFYLDDSDLDGRQQILAHPIQHIRLQITKNVVDPDEAEKRIRLAVYRGVLCQSKLSVTYVWARWYVIAIDLYSLSVIHHFDADGGEIVAVTHMGDLPAVAVLNHENILFVYAIRPSTVAGTLLARRDLNDVAPRREPSTGMSRNDSAAAGTMKFDRRTRNSIVKFRKQSVLRQHEERFVSAVISEFVPADDSAPTGIQGMTMRFHQGKRVLYISDAVGSLWEWSLEDFIKRSELVSMYYPLQSVTEHVLRRPSRAVCDPDGLNGIYLVKAFAALVDEEIRFFETVFYNSSTRFLIGAGDNRVTAWTTSGDYLGQLSQGRLLHAERITDAMALRQLYERYNVRPWRFDEAPPDTDSHISEDLPPNVLLMLRRAAHRFRARKRALGRRNQSPDSPTSPVRRGSLRKQLVTPSQSQQPEGTQEAPAATALAAAPPGRLASREGSRRGLSLAADEPLIQVIAGDGVDNDKVPFRDPDGESQSQLPFSQSERNIGDSFMITAWHPPESSSATATGGAQGLQPITTAATKQPYAVPMVPKAKFKVRGACVVQAQPLSTTTSILRSMPSHGDPAVPLNAILSSPRRTAQPMIPQRADMQLTSIGEKSQREARDEAQDRATAAALHVPWNHYHRLVRSTKEALDHTPMDLSKCAEAQSMRRVFIPQLPSGSKPPSRGDGQQQGRLPLTARDMEKYAVARLLGGDGPQQAMDDLHLHDRGALR